MDQRPTLGGPKVGTVMTTFLPPAPLKLIKDWELIKDMLPITLSIELSCIGHLEF